VQMSPPGHSLFDAQATHALVVASQWGVAARLAQSLELRHAPAASGAQQPPWHELPPAHESLVVQLAWVEGHWLAPTHSSALQVKPLAQSLCLLQLGFLAGPLQPVKITTEQRNAPSDRRRAATADIETSGGERARASSDETDLKSTDSRRTNRRFFSA